MHIVDLSDSEERNSVEMVSYTAIEDIVVEPIPEEYSNNLETVFDYFIKEKFGNSIPFGAWEKVSLVLEAIGGSGGIYVLPTAWQYGMDKSPFVKYSMVVTNPLSNVLFLAHATDNLLDIMGVENRLPPALTNVIELPSKKELGLKYLKMTLGSLVCAAPFGIAVFLFPLPYCDSTAGLAATVTHSILANTILHAISWGILLEPRFWYYRLPFLPIEKAYQALRNFMRTSLQKQALSIQTQEEAIYTKYREILINTFTVMVERIVNQSRKTPEVIDLKAIVSSDSSVTELARIARECTPLLQESSVHASPGRFRSFLNTTHRFLGNGGVGFIGGALTVIGGMGWVASPIYFGLKEGLTLVESIFAGLLPTYSTGVLFAFYGAIVFNQLYQYLTSWKGGLSDKFSMEARLYPKTFSLFLLFNLYIASFAYGSAQELIITIFGDEMWDAYRPIMQDVSMPIFILLSFVPLLNLFNTLVRKSAAKFGKENDEAMAARLLLKTSVMSNYMRYMNGALLIESLSQYSLQQQSTLGVDPEGFMVDKATLHQLKQKRDQLTIEQASSVRQKQLSITRSGFNFFRSGTSEEKRRLLAPELDQVSYSIQ